MWGHRLAIKWEDEHDEREVVSRWEDELLGGEGEL